MSHTVKVERLLTNYGEKVEKQRIGSKKASGAEASSATAKL